MQKSNVALAAALVTVLFLLPTPGWAMMCQSHMGSHGSHGDHQSSHENHGSLQEHGDHQADTAMQGHREAMDEMYDEYFAIQSQLANDSLEGISDRAKKLSKCIGQFHHEGMRDSVTERERHMHDFTSDIEPIVDSLAKREDIESARDDFGKLSEKMIEYHKKYGKEHMQDTHMFVCDMKKMVWLQEDSEPRNPYYGSKMPKCARELK